MCLGGNKGVVDKRLDLDWIVAGFQHIAGFKVLQFGVYVAELQHPTLQP